MFHFSGLRDTNRLWSLKATCHISCEMTHAFAGQFRDFRQYGKAGAVYKAYALQVEAHLCTRLSHKFCKLVPDQVSKKGVEPVHLEQFYFASSLALLNFQHICEYGISMGMETNAK